MRILKVVLKDFGQHALLEADFNSPVVGVLGVNGAGKSTLLRALRFAFTGLLDDNAETYVRNNPARKAAVAETAGQEEGREEGPTNGSVSVTFSVGEVSGTIFRQVGKSPRHQLEWGERTGKNAIKNVKEIQALLTNLIGADQQALDNAVFIPQGEMQSLLFGDNAQREKLYARMLLVSFCDQVYQKANERATRLSSGLKDLQATQDEATAATAATRQELHRLIGDSNAYPALAKDAVQAFESWARNRGSLISGELHAASLQQEYKLAQGRAVEAETALLDVTCCADAEAAAVQLKQAAAALASAKQTEALLAAAVAAKQQLAQAELTHQTSLAEAEAAALKVKQVQDMLAAHPGSAGLEASLKASADFRRAQQEMAVNRARLLVITDELPRLAKQLEACRAEGVQAAAAVEAAKSAEAEPRIRFELLSTIVKAASQVSCCPICDSAIAANKLGPAALEDARAKLKQATDKRTQEEVTYNALRTKYQTLLVEQKQLQNEQAQLATQANEILRRVQVDSIVQLQYNAMTPEIEAKTTELLQRVRQAESQLPVLQSAESQAVRRVSAALLDLTNASSRLEEAVNATAGLVVDPGFNRQERESSLQRGTQALQAANNAKAAVAQAEAAKQTAAQRNQELSALCAAGEVEINKHHALTTILAKADPSLTPLGYLDACRKSINDYQQVCAELRAKVDQQTKMVAEMENRENQVREAISRNEKQRALVDDLRAVARVFHRDGLPIYYMRQRFGEIVELTSYFLGKLDSDFLVRADPERAVAFQFARLLDGTDTWLNQEKLSGGQRVRLTVAFLLAVQQLVIPDVGLLILDEPSMHLDVEGKESLASMLQELGPRLVEQGAQLVVCDHAEEIVRSLPKRVILKPKITAELSK